MCCIVTHRMCSFVVFMLKIKSSWFKKRLIGHM